MSRIQQAFEHAKSENRGVLVTYLCAGDPDLQTSEAMALAAANSGADIIELGVPFSDPSADGPVIQRASERALAAGTTLAKVLRVAANLRRDSEVPIVLFGYCNPLLAYGPSLAKDLKQAGVDGVLVVDLPPEMAAEIRDPIVAAGLDFVPLIAPTTPEPRLQQAAQAATSFLYYVSVTGVTGSQDADLQRAAGLAKQAAAQVSLPVVVGFGVKSPKDVYMVCQQADGAVVGSALVLHVEQAIETSRQSELPTIISEFVASLAAQTRRS